MECEPVGSEAALGTSFPLCGHQQGWSQTFLFLLFPYTQWHLMTSLPLKLGPAMRLALANEFPTEGTCVASGRKS